MSLATRCTSCGTVFRVVQDQLKVSEGWVRCGRCDAVFNALEGLFDLGRDSPPEWSGAPTPALSAETAPEDEPADIGVDVDFDPPPSPSPARTPTPAPRRPALHRRHPAFVEPSRPTPTRAILELVPVDGAGGVRRPARRPDRRPPVQEARPGVGCQGRRARPARVLRRPLRLRPVRRELVGRRGRFDRIAGKRCRRPAARERPSAARLPAPRRAQGALAQRPGAARARRSAARSPRWCCCCRSAITSATPSPPAGPPPGRSSSPGASSPTAASRRRAGSTRCWSTAPRSPGRSASTPSFCRSR